MAEATQGGGYYHNGRQDRVSNALDELGLATTPEVARAVGTYLDTTDVLATAPDEIVAALDHLRTVCSKLGGVTLALVGCEAVAASTDETLHAPGERLFELKDRALAYVQSIFGDISDLELREDDLVTLACVIHNLQGSGQYSDRTVELQLMFHGMTDVQISAMTDMPHGALDRVYKHIKRHHSYNSARAALMEWLNPTNSVIEPEISVDASDDVVSWPVAVTPATSPRRRPVSDEVTTSVRRESATIEETANIGKLRGQIRRLLKNSGSDYMTDLSIERMADLMNQVFTRKKESVSVREAYVKWLNTNVPAIGDDAFSAYRMHMAQYVHGTLVEPDEVASVESLSTEMAAEFPQEVVTPVVETELTQAPVGPSPLMMPKTTRRLTYSPPQNMARRHLMTDEPALGDGHQDRSLDSHEETVHFEPTEPREVPPLIAAAYNEQVMGQETWYKQAHAFVAQVAAPKLGLSDDSSKALWDAVHFQGTRPKNATSTIETRQALRAVYMAMTELDDESWHDYTELASCLKQLVDQNAPRTVGEIQKQLVRKNETTSSYAAARLLVAALQYLVDVRFPDTGEAVA